MFGCIVDHVAALAQRFEVRRRAVAGIVIKVRAGQDDIGHPDRRQREPGLHRDPLATVGPPAPDIGIPPASVAKMDDAPQMRPAAPLAPSTGTIEPDRLGQLPPVDRVEPAVLGADRHDDSMSHPPGKRKRIIRPLLPLRIFSFPSVRRGERQASCPDRDDQSACNVGVGNGT